MKHIMHLDSKYFYLILNNKKNIEIRLYDNKRKNLNIGDTIMFINNENKKEKIYVKINNIKYYRSFKELFLNSTSTELKWLDSSIDSMIKEMNNIYPKELEKKFGVIKISFEKCGD